VNPVSRRLTAAVSPAHPRSARVRRHHPIAPIASSDPVHRAHAPEPAEAAADANDSFRDPGGYGSDPEPCVLRCGDLVLDESRWTVHRAGALVELSPTEFRLLACLLRHQGSVLTRAELLQRVWGRGYTGQPQVVETYVSYLRRKLHRLGPPLIHTRRGLGYLLRRPDPAESGPDGPGPELS
jgi:DNA-binding response OmpR family regulator